MSGGGREGALPRKFYLQQTPVSSSPAAATCLASAVRLPSPGAPPCPPSPRPVARSSAAPAVTSPRRPELRRPSPELRLAQSPRAPPSLARVPPRPLSPRSELTGGRRILADCEGCGDLGIRRPAEVGQRRREPTDAAAGADGDGCGDRVRRTASEARWVADGDAPFVRRDRALTQNGTSV